MINDFCILFLPTAIWGLYVNFLEVFNFVFLVPKLLTMNNFFMHDQILFNSDSPGVVVTL